MRASFKESGRAHDGTVIQIKPTGADKLGASIFETIQDTNVELGSTHSGEFSGLLGVSLKDMIPNYPNIIAVVPDEGNEAT
jgi:hypothetical protein